MQDMYIQKSYTEDGSWNVAFIAEEELPAPEALVGFLEAS